MTTPEPTSSADQPTRAYPIEAEEALSAWITNQTAGVWTSPAGWWYAAWMHREPEVASLRADLEHTRQIVGAQAEVIEAAQNWRDGWFNDIGALRIHEDRLMVALARLDAADVPATREGK